MDQYTGGEEPISKPSICIVSGDLVHGVAPGHTDPIAELERQYQQTEELLVGLADRFFGGERDRVVILPGNHDVDYPVVMSSMRRTPIPADPGEKEAMVAALFRPRSRVRWSWSELCFYEIVDEERYAARFEAFAQSYARFYGGKRTFSLMAESQHAVFDFPAFGLTVLALNSCFENDPLHRAGAIHPDSLARVCEEARAAKRAGWLIAAAWHHNFAGSPSKDDRLDADLLQHLIDVGVSLGFHGHQHLPECVDERFRIGPKPRKMTLVSASTLCAGPANLTPGVPRSYNVVELDTESWNGRVHQRQMVNGQFAMPVWGPGHFVATSRSFVGFDLAKPLQHRPRALDSRLKVEEADRLIGSGDFERAIEVLAVVRDDPVARPLLVRALSARGTPSQSLEMLWPPTTAAEAVVIGGALLEGGTAEKAREFLALDVTAKGTDPSVREIVQRVKQGLLR